VPTKGGPYFTRIDVDQIPTISDRLLRSMACSH
jgi:hypothetical protein